MKWREMKKAVLVLPCGKKIEFYGRGEQIKVEAWNGNLIKEEVVTADKARQLATYGLELGGKWLYK